MKKYCTLLFTFFLCLNSFSQAPVFEAEEYQKALWMTTRYYGSQRMGGGTNWLVWDMNYDLSDAPDSIKKKVVKVPDVNFGKSFMKDYIKNYDLTGGWFSSEGSVLDGRTFFYSVYMLLLGYSEFTLGYDDLYSENFNGYIVSGKYNWEDMKGKPDGTADILNECKYATDFIQKAVYSADTFFCFKGDLNLDKKVWCTSVYKSGFSKAEGGESDTARTITAATGRATTMSALAGASLAAMSRLYKADDIYAVKCLQKAKTAYEFATQTEEGNFTKEKFYPDLTILCAELFRATGEETYKQKCDEYTSKWIDDYNHHTILNCYNTEEVALYAYCAMGQGNTYYEKAKEGLKNLVNSYPAEGGIIISNNNEAPLKYAAGGAFAQALYSKLDGSKEINPNVLKTVEYIMGDNSKEFSFITGFGGNSPQKPNFPNYFRSDLGEAEAAFESGNNAKYRQLGLLVGGTLNGGDYDDSFSNPQSYGGTDFNAPLVGALAYIVEKISPVDNSKVVLRTVTMKKQPSKKIYEVGEELDVSDGVLTAVYSDGTSQDTKILKSMVTNFSSEKGGKYTLQVSYLGRLITYPIEVLKHETGIRISKAPQTEYLIGEELSLDSATVQLVYNDKSFDETPLTTEMVSGFSSDTAGTVTLEITYQNWSTSLEITVLKSPVVFAEIYKTPTKTTYYQREALDVTGGKIHVVYEDETEDVLSITAHQVSGFDSSQPGRQTLTVTYAGRELTYEIEILQSETPVRFADIEPGKIFSYGNTIRLENITGKVEVYNISGRKVFSGVDVNEIFIRKSGIYIVKTGKITKKVFIK